MFNNNCASVPLVADIGNGCNNGYGGYGYGMDGMWAWWIVIMAMFGWGGFGGGYGWGGGGGYAGQQFTQADIQRSFDTQSLLNGQCVIEQGLCSLGYDQLGQMNPLGNTVQQTGWNLQQTMTQGQISQMQANNALSAQISQCCCDEKLSEAQTRYDMATLSCATNTNIHQTGDAIIQNQNAGFSMLNQTIKDGFCDLEKREMMRENADLRQRLNDCSRDSALQGTANYIIGSINPPPKPAYFVPNPNTGCCWPQNGYSDCGCGNSHNQCDRYCA